MYQDVYIDAVFAANFLMDYILLRLTGFFIREGRNRRRCLMAAAGGALFSSISVCISADQIPRLWSIVQIFCAAGIIRLAYPIRSWKRLAMAVLIFYVLAFLSGGIWTEVIAFHIDRKPDNDSPDNADKQVHRGKTRQGI